MLSSVVVVLVSSCVIVVVIVAVIVLVVGHRAASLPPRDGRIRQPMPVVWRSISTPSVERDDGDGADPFFRSDFLEPVAEGLELAEPTLPVLSLTARGAVGHQDARTLRPPSAARPMSRAS